ncbi:SPT3 Dosage dependent suppressor of Ty-induced promoter mutations-like protein [Ceratobasidium sp. 394]|nr:SPT3 Dosage dependent suppressor of Ty-induced promoter mutations-like protein [Ceratobasidium sp. 394]
MRSRSSSPNTPSSDSSPSSSDLPLAAPIAPEIPKELEENQLFNAFINDSAFDAATPVIAAPTAPYERLHSVLSSAYHVPPAHVHVVRPSASALIHPPPLGEDLDEPEPLPDAKHEGQVVSPPKESCVNLPIRVRNVPLQGAKSRVETQLKVTIDLVWDPTPRSHYHPPSLPGYAHPTSDPSAPTVGSWEYLALPAGSATKRRGRKDAKIAPTPEQTLTLHTIVNVASAPHTAARACKKCLAREAKRAERKRRGPNDMEPAPFVEPGTGLEDDKIVLYNCADVLDFKAGTVDLPVRLTCYCRHHSEKLGFRITFILRDHTGRTVGIGVTPPILITDDHKSTARKVQVQAQQQVQPPAATSRKGAKDKSAKQHRMQKPYARSAGPSRASSIGLGGAGMVKEEVGFGGFGNGNGGSSYGTPSTQGYTSPPPQSPSHYASTNPGMFAVLGSDGFQLGDGMVPAGSAALLSPTRSAFLSPPRSPVHSRTHTRPQTPRSRMHSPVQTRSHSPARGPVLASPVHSRSHSRNGRVPGLEGVLGELELGALGPDMLMGMMGGEGLLSGSNSLLGAGDGALLGMGDGFVSGQFTPVDSQMLDGSFDPAQGGWEAGNLQQQPGRPKRWISTYQTRRRSPA